MEDDQTTCGCKESHHTAEEVEQFKDEDIWVDKPRYILEPQPLNNYIIGLTSVHYYREATGLTKRCRDCDSFDTSKNKFGGVDYEPGWMCHACGLHGIGFRDWLHTWMDYEGTQPKQTTEKRFTGVGD